MTDSENFGNYRAPFEALGVMSNTVLGGATVGIVSAKKATETVKMLWKKAEYELLSEIKEIPVEYYKEK